MLYLPNFKFYHKVGGLTNKDRHDYKSDFEIKFTIRNRVYKCKKYFSLLTIVYLAKFIIKENLRVMLKKGYKRSFNTMILLNQSFIQGLFYK